MNLLCVFSTSVLCVFCVWFVYHFRVCSIAFSESVACELCVFCVWFACHFLYFQCLFCEPVVCFSAFAVCVFFCDLRMAGV